MDSNFASMCPSSDRHLQVPAPQDSGRPKFFAAVSSLVAKSVRRSRRPKNSPLAHSNSASEWSLGHSQASSRPCSQDCPRPQATWKKRGQTPDMDDYLSLSQLEYVWQCQDSFIGSMGTPVTSKIYRFEEIAEAPTIIKHKYDATADQPADDISIAGSAPADDSTVVDGVVHPALRPTPYLQNYKRTRSAPYALRIQTSGLD